jgi:hypothetical protein
MVGPADGSHDGYRNASKRIERLEHIGRLLGSRGVQVAPDYFSRADEKRLAAKHARDKRHAEGLRRVALRVGQQREGQMVLFLEAFLRLRPVDAEAHDFHAALLQHGETVAQAARLFRAAGGFRPGIKIDERKAGPVILAERDFVTIDGEDQGIGCVRADFERASLGSEAEPGEKAHG